jgi:HK97 family phage major capsid protein
MTASREQLETEIRALGKQSVLTPANERQLAQLTRDLSATLGHPVTVHRGGQAVCISTDITSRRKAPAPAVRARRTTARDIADGVPFYDLVPAGSATRSAPRHSLAENRERAHRIIDRDLAVDVEHLLSAGYGQVRDAALRTLERKAAHLAPRDQDRLDDLLRTRNADVDGKDLARHVVLTSSDAYVSAFNRSISEAHPAWTPQESVAVNAWRELASERARKEHRAASEAGSFGLGIPVLIDPAVIIQSQDQAEILAAAKQVLLTTNAWKGVSSAGATIAFDAEAVVGPDAAVTMAQPTVPIYKADGTLVVSYEMYQDYPSFTNEALRMFGAALNDNVSDYTGSGSSVPTGIFTAMSGTTNPAHVKVTTAGQIAANDVRAVFGALPERYQLNASWLMSPSMVQTVSTLAAPSVTNGLAPHDWTPATQGQPARLLGRPVYVSSYAPSFTGTTGAANYCVVGDFSRFLVATRLGSTLELVPQMFNFAGSYGMPTAQRGLYYLARWGSAPTDVQAFRLLSNS